MTTAMDRGWLDPRDPGYRKKFIVPVTVGPFPAGLAVKTPHPKVTINVHRDIALLLQLALNEVIGSLGYRLDGPQLDDWGYICRPIRGYETRYAEHHDLRYLSNHSWGLAVDINAAQFPLGSKKRVPEKVVECMRRYGFEYGGDYVHRKDPMHWEVTMTRAAAQQKQGDLLKFFAALKKAA